METDYKAQMLLQEGADQYFAARADLAERVKGFLKVRQAAVMEHREALYLYGRILVEDLEVREKVSGSRVKAEDLVGNAWRCLYTAARQGSLSAKHFLDQVCKKRYEQAFPPAPAKAADGRLRDFDGEIIGIRRTGLFTPVDAVLDYRDGVNELTFSLDLFFALSGTEASKEELDCFQKAVIDGILAWEGDYEVFGGQHVRVRIDLSVGQNSYDHVSILLLTDEMEKQVLGMVGKVPWSDPDVVENSDAMTVYGFRGWSVNSRKIIYFRNMQGKFREKDYIKHLSKHEFGHVLGLGDLYRSAAHGLAGTDSAGYAELESYEIYPQAFHLVMDNSYGPISNNDIEMVILAFSENRLQSYQPDKINKYVSEALGRGN